MRTKDGFKVVKAAKPIDELLNVWPWNLAADVMTTRWDFLQRNACDEGKEQGNAHDCQERMNLQLGDEKDHEDDRDNKRDDQRKTSHNRTLLTKYGLVGHG